MEIYRTPIIQRRPVFNRTPISPINVTCVGCIIGDTSCNGTEFCSPRTSLEEKDIGIFRLIRVTQEDTDWEEILEDVRIIKENKCSVRMVSDVPIPKEVLFELAYNPYNVVQFNIDLFDNTTKTAKIKSSLFVADNCGLYTSILLYPIIPSVVKTWDVLEFMNSLRCTCNTLCFRFIELDSDIEYSPEDDSFNVNGYSLPKSYMTLKDYRYVCKDSFKESFSSIIMAYMSPRKINCSLCNDYVCY